MIELPIRAESLANKREHWAVKGRRANEQRSVARLATPAGLKLPLTVKLTRLGPRLLDSDNLAISLKHVRDGIADKVQVDDGNQGWTWEYAQEKSKVYAVRIEFL